MNVFLWNARARNGHVEATLNHPFPAQVLHDLLPASLELSRRELPGIYNFCNPGAISHNQVLEQYKKYVDPTFTWKNFTVEEQNKILAAKRSNNELDCSKLVNALPDMRIPDIHTAMAECMQRTKKHLDSIGWKPTPRA